MAPKKDPSPGAPLSSKQICSIIDACAKGNVKTVEYQGLKLEFFRSQADQVIEGSEEVTGPRLVAYPDLSEAAVKKLAEDDLVAEELAHKEERAALMLIEDPGQWERMIAAGEFEPPEPTEKVNDEVIENAN
jgi:hypothetical protein